MKKILITGANGMLGSDACIMFSQKGYEVIKSFSKDLDITKANDVFQYIDEVKPDIVLHCAAYTDVEKAEDEFEKAMEVNYSGTLNIAKGCSKADIPVIHISTDYVFDGKNNTKYTISDIPKPINNYGISKLCAEKAIKQHCKKYYIVRTSWLYGINSKVNFVEKMLSKQNDKTLYVVNDQLGCPTWTVDLLNGILEIIQSENYGIYHVCSSGEASWFEFAKEIFKNFDIKINLKPCSSKDFKTKAQRPVYSVMENNGILRHWREGLEDYAKLRKKEVNKR